MNNIIEYALRRHYPSGIRNILHVGACKGEELPSYEKMGAQNIVWVEANPALVNGALTENLNRNTNVRNIVINRAVTDRDGDTVTLNVIADDEKSNEGASSIMAPTLHLSYYPGLKVQSVVDVKTITLNTILSKLDFTIDFMAMDIRGAELMALLGASDVLKQPSLKTISMEIATEPLYKGAALVMDIDKFLWDYNFVRQDTFMLHEVWGDALYVRRK